MQRTDNSIYNENIKLLVEENVIPSALAIEIPSPAPQPSVKNMGLFANKYQYDNTEEYIRLCLPAYGCTHDALREAVTDGRYVISDPLLGFRCDSRKPEEIFVSGFSAYAFQRMDMFPACGSFDLNLYNLFWYTIAPMLTCAPCMIPCELLTCLIYGNDTYAYPFDSRWPALALTTGFPTAQQGFGAHANFNYRYLVYMDGAIDFCHFSNDYVKKFPHKDMRGHPKKPYLRDENEIFPPDLDHQSIDGTQVIASTIPNEDANDRCVTFEFNPRFTFFEKIKPYLNDKNTYKCAAKQENIESFFKALANKFNIRYIPSLEDRKRQYDYSNCSKKGHGI